MFGMNPEEIFFLFAYHLFLSSSVLFSAKSLQNIFEPSDKASPHRRLSTSRLAHFTSLRAELTGDSIYKYISSTTNTFHYLTLGVGLLFLPPALCNLICHLTWQYFRSLKTRQKVCVDMERQDKRAWGNKDSSVFLSRNLWNSCSFSTDHRWLSEENNVGGAE